ACCHDSALAAGSQERERPVNLVERKGPGDARADHAVGDEPDGIAEVPAGTIARADDLELALGELDRVDPRELGLLPDHDDLAAAPQVGGGLRHRLGLADAFEYSLGALAVGELTNRPGGLLVAGGAGPREL